MCRYSRFAAPSAWTQTRRSIIRAALRLLIGLMFLAGCLQARAEDRSAAAARQILDDARAEAARDCSRPAGVLVRVLCNRQLRVGLRTYYPGFSVRDASGGFAGYEVDVARHIADFLGVRLVPVAVDPKTRIPLVASQDIDLVIATMGHTVQRDDQVTFIRPHYYQSQTVIIGPTDRQITGWDDLTAQTVCLPVGASSSCSSARHHIRILTFDRPEQLLDALAFHQCAFIVHDNTFFAGLLANPQWSSHFNVKFGFAPQPWGMAVARRGAAAFASLLTDLSIAYHADGVFLDLARAHALDQVFLAQEQQRWSSPGCITASGTADASCLISPADDSDAADTSRFAGRATWLEGVASQWFGLQLNLSLLQHQSTVDLLLGGITYSLALVSGTLLATTGFALAFARLMGSGPLVVRRAVGAVTAIGQTSPLPLLLFFGYVVAGGLTQYTGLVALAVAILVIGFYNGSNAARAINEAYQAAQQRSFLDAVSAAGIQLVAFLINATKGSPAAGMIGVPEFLNVMTDLTAYSRDRAAVYVVLLVFYTGLVLAVIFLLSVAETRLAITVERRA